MPLAGRCLASKAVATESANGAGSGGGGHRGAAVARIEVAAGEEVCLFLPLGRPVPAVGVELPLLVEQYEDGRVFYRVAPGP